MRSLIGLYLSLGIVMLLIGFFASGECHDRNIDVFSNLFFVLGWPGYLYRDVVSGAMTTGQLLHQQACGGGIVVFSPVR